MEGYLLSIVFLVIIVVLLVKIKSLSKELKEEKEEIEELQANISYQNNQIISYKEKLNSIENRVEELEEIKKRYEVLLEEHKKLEIENSELKKEIALLKEIKEKYESLSSENVELKTKNQELQTKLQEIKNSYDEKIELLSKSEERLKESFENLANEILKRTNEELVKNSKSNLEVVLNPISNQLKEFKEKIESLSKEEAEKISALQNELKNLKELSHKLSDEAENLTKALKGEVKTQGNWGEMVLERVLELSGLRKGKEYEREVNLKEDTKTYRPDVIVHLPNNRDVIIDAKTSLKAYNEYIKTEDKKFIKEHIKSLKKHIDTLANKQYEKLEGVNSLDFVFMFVPIENALLLALENDSELFEYAFRKKVILVSPTTLLVSLRAIESAWRFERQSKSIEEVVRVAENLYDKVRGFVEEFEKIGKSLDAASKSYESAKNRLTDGRGNVIRQIELLKEKANIKPKKEISKEIRELAFK